MYSQLNVEVRYLELMRTPNLIITSNNKQTDKVILNKMIISHIVKNIHRKNSEYIWDTDFIVSVILIKPTFILAIFALQMVLREGGWRL